jgi:hypothetical protein
MDDSMRHNGNKISEKLAKRSIERAPYPLYSPDISPGECWLFGMLEHKMKDREFRSQQGILSAVAKVWNDLTFADVQCVFQEWIQIGMGKSSHRVSEQSLALQKRIFLVHFS